MLEEGESLNWWWFQIQQNKAPSNPSPWLLSTLAELDNKTLAMVKLIQQDAVSFSQYAEMYYNKRPLLISMVRDFHQTHRSLAERYDRINSNRRNLVFSGLSCPVIFTMNESKEVELDESEVVDPEEQVVGSGSGKDECRRLKEELERLGEENEEKRDVITQLSLGMDLLLEENTELEKCFQLL